MQRYVCMILVVCMNKHIVVSKHARMKECVGVKKYVVVNKQTCLYLIPLSVYVYDGNVHGATVCVRQYSCAYVLYDTIYRKCVRV